MEETIYSVSQAVKLLETQSHVLRYWEEELALPIKRNEMGHRYYTRWDIQVFLSIKELKKRGYSLKEIGELTPFFYPDQVLDKKKSREKKKKPETAGGDQKPERIPSEFMDIISRLVVQRLKEQDSEEDRYKRLDQRIRDCQQSRREVAASAEKTQRKGKLLHESIIKKNSKRR